MLNSKEVFIAVLNEASTITSTWGFPRQFLNKKAQKTKAYFDQISEGITLSDPKKRFCITVFLPMMDKLFCQLINRFEGMKSVVTSYQVLEPSFLSNALIWILRLKPENFLTNFLVTSLRCFLAKSSPSKRRLEKKIAHLKSAKEMASFSIVENTLLATTYPDVRTAYMMYMTVRITVAMAKRSFSKLKLIKNFL